MRKIVLFTCMIVCFTVSLVAQTEGTRLPYTGSVPDLLGGPRTKSVTCGTDTIIYPYLKELVFAAPADSFFVDAMVGNVRTASQAYLVAEPITIHGIQFWGGAYSTSTAPQTLSVRAYLYAVDAFNMPTAKLDSVDITVTQEQDFYEGVFSTPYEFAGTNFAVAVRSIPSDTLFVMTNNAGNIWSPNYGESLGWRRFGSGAWNSTVSFFGQDVDYMIFPIVSYDIATSFTTNGPSECTGSLTEFTNTSSSLLSNRMFNLLAFDEYWGFAAADSTFTWDYDDAGATVNVMEGSYTYTAGGSYNVSLQAEMLGYYSTCNDTYTAMVTVVETPQAGLNLTGTIGFCEGGTIELSATPSAGVTYEWLHNGEGTDSTEASFLLSEAGDYTVITTNTCGTDTSETATATLSLPPVAGLNISSPFELCDGESISLEATPATGIDYQWVLNGTPVNDSIFSSYYASEAGSYALIVTNNCGADTSDTIVINMNAEPIASLNVTGALSFCEGGSVMLTAVPSSGANYEWLQDGVAIPDSVDGSFIVTEGGDYTVIASNACGLDTALMVTVNVHDLPQQPVIIGSGEELEVDLSTVAPGVQYQWYVDGGPIDEGTEDTLVPQANGMYTVMITDANGCFNTSEAFEVDDLGLSQPGDVLLIVAPNPASGFFNVSYGPQQLSFHLYDGQGKLVEIEPVIQEGYIFVATFSVQDLSDGIYTLRASGTEGTAVERIVVKN